MDTSTSTTEPSEPAWAALRELRFRLRSDLQIRRQIYEKGPVYVVHDPVSFRSHRLSLAQYRILALLNAEQTPAENFDRLVERGELGADDEEAFYQLFMSLSRLGLIVMSTVTGSALYERWQQTVSLKRRSRILGLLFLQIPLVNPDQFLARTVHRVA